MESVQDVGLRIDKADKAFSEYIRTRDNWTCQRCHKKYQPPTRALHCSHFKGRRKEATRFEPLNADALCYGCHQYFTSQPDEHRNWQVQKKGLKIVEQLELLANTYKKKDRELEYIYWKKELEKLKK